MSEMENLNKEQLLERHDDLVWQLKGCQKTFQRYVNQLVEGNIHTAKKVQEDCEFIADVIVELRTKIADAEQRIEAI